MAKRSRVGTRRAQAPAPRVDASRAAHPTTGDPATVVLRTPKRPIQLQTTAPAVNLAQAAMQWTYVVRSRQRWSSTETTANQQARAAADLLQELGVDADALADLARAGMVEVSTKWLGSEETDWAARIFPWEYVIAGATRSLRGDLPLTVMRHLDRGEKATPKNALKRVLFVASEPGPLRGYYSFDAERELVKTHLQVNPANWREVKSPTAAELTAAVSEFKPDLVHLAGFDTHEARAVIRQSSKRGAATEDDPSSQDGADERQDGYVLAGPKGFHHVRSEELGQILTSKGHRPRLVALNIRNSAARIAPLTVAAGTWAAIGFQDIFDDDLAELFFSVLYSRLSRSGWDLTNAFRSAWERVRSQPGTRQGSGIVLWSATPLFAADGVLTARRSGEHYTQLAEQLSKREETSIEAGEVKARDVGKWITVDVEVVQDLNYSLLHNQRSLFKRFVLTCPNPHSRTIRNVRVKVSLYAGTEAAAFDRALDLRPPSIDLQDIHVPLTSAITRSVHESVRTSLFVEVIWGEHVLYRNTIPVRLIPVDQWRDSDDDRKWLPSFVFPRDPAVVRLVDTAQRYVRVLRDDPAAGFDGYQSFDGSRPDDTAGIDLQVQALWSTIVHELRLGYINPPPGYSNELDSQRLRTPSMVVTSNSGTCIDLALFFAACLELIDIYPVIFLLEGHAFPGYWRRSEDHDQFRKARPPRINEIVQADSRTSTIFGAQREAWLLGKPTYREIVQFVNAGKLVPIETVRLTENCGFAEAIEAGRDNLRDEREFAAMVDIVLAREEQVTPLPILGETT